MVAKITLVIPMLVVVVAVIVVSSIAFQAYALALSHFRGCPSHTCVSVSGNGATLVTGDTIAAAGHGGLSLVLLEETISVRGAPGFPQAQHRHNHNHNHHHHHNHNHNHSHAGQVPLKNQDFSITSWANISKPRVL